jgi:hypothetical protein
MTKHPTIMARASAINTVTALFDRILNWGPAIAAFLGTGVVGTVVAYYTDWIRPWGPFAMLVAGLTVAIIIGVLALMIIAVMNRRLVYKINEKFGEQTLAINPLEDNFTKQRVKLMDFHSPFGTVSENKTFHGCEIIGPGLLMLHTSHMSQTSFFNCDVIEITEGTVISDNAIRFKDTTFRDCKFYKITLILDPPMAAKMREVGLIE